MTETCILRFRDLTGDDSIRLHREIISAAGYVWWGWWKKDHEPERRAELEKLRERARSGSLEMGLFDRSRPAYFSATITDCIFSDGEIASPEPNKTPSYYSTEKVAAWFKVVAIEVISTTAFEGRFTVPPSGDFTFFPISRRGSVQTSNVASTVRLASSTILHLSDLHLGGDYGFPTSRRSGAAPLLDVIEHDFQNEKPGLVVISGDFTTRADANVLQDDGIRFLNEMSNRLRLPKECFVLVPGNHDIALKKWRPQDYSHETSYHLFVKEFYGFRRPLPELQRFRLADGRFMELLTINSVRLRHESERQFGYVQWSLYESLLKKVPYDPAVVRIAVLHHHLVPAPREEPLNPEYPEASVSTTLDAGSVIEGLQHYGFSLVLHGHQHVPAVTRISRASRNSSGSIGNLGANLFVIAAGSAGAAQARLSDEMRDNSYNLLRLSAKRNEVEAKRYTPSSRPQTLFRFDLG